MSEKFAPSEVGKIWIEDGTLFYRGEELEDWELPVFDIRVVGEDTTGNMDDPWAHMVVFVAAIEACGQAPALADGLPGVLSELESRWNARLRPGLQGPGPPRSRVLHPPQLRGQPLFAPPLLPEASPDAPDSGLPQMEILQPELALRVKEFLVLP